MNLHIVRAAIDGDDIWWIVFFEGHLTQPVAVISDINVSRLLKDIERQRAEALKKQRA